jgi:hypothetical protein
MLGKSEEKRPLGPHQYMWENNIKMDLRGIEWSGMDWADMGQKTGKRKALVNTVMDLWGP